ncbi:tetratricopeptide repeat protein [Candidatus Auribacterota bacterium]
MIQKKAIDDYNKAIQIDPLYTNAYIHRGTVYFNNKKFSNAINDYKRAMKTNPNDPRSYVFIAHAYYETGQYVQAMNNLKIYEKLGLQPPADLLKKLQNKLPQ